MTVSHLYSLTDTYTAVENAAGDVTAGTFSVYAQTNVQTNYIIATSPPSGTAYHFGLVFKGLTFKVELQVGEFLYGRTEGVAKTPVGVITS